MATRKGDQPAEPRTRKKAVPAKKPAAAPRKRGSAPAVARQAVPATPSGAAGGLLRAGLKALGNVHHDVVERQAHVVESLLGARAAEKLKAHAFPGAGSFGFRKFEDVFDQRVATALERLGMPAPREIETLREEVRQLRAQLDALAGAQQGRR